MLSNICLKNSEQNCGNCKKEELNFGKLLKKKHTLEKRTNKKMQNKETNVQVWECCRKWICQKMYKKFKEVKQQSKHNFLK